MRSSVHIVKLDLSLFAIMVSWDQSHIVHSLEFESCGYV